MTNPVYSFPSYSRSALIADNCIHVFGIAAGITGVIVMFVAAAPLGDGFIIASITLYCLGLFAMVCSSALYNMSRPSPRKALFRRLDHAAIFVMIAGSYTPFAAKIFSGFWGYTMLAAIWLVALSGAAMKIMVPHRFGDRASTVVYLLLGWGGFATLVPLFGAVPLSILWLILGGGVFYSLGTVFHHWERLPFHNAIWHGLILVAAACHYSAILGGVVLFNPAR